MNFSSLNYFSFVSSIVPLRTRSSAGFRAINAEYRLQIQLKSLLHECCLEKTDLLIEWYCKKAAGYSTMEPKKKFRNRLPARVDEINMSP